MTICHKATQIRLLDFRSVPMRAFHMSWLAFFLCFFGWFGLLMPMIRGELHLSKQQVGNSMIASVAITILVRLLVGWLCDRIGPRRTYTWLLILGSLPVMGVGLAHDFTSFLLFRLAIGGIGASFVITQYHTSVMFAPNIVGTANAASAGWGNLGGGVTQIAMPLLVGAFLSLGVGPWWGWRLAMMTAGVALLLTGVAYYFLTRDTPDGDFSELRKKGESAGYARSSGAFAAACRDRRVWALALLYAASFGIELTIDNVAALYFTDYFRLGLAMAGIVAGSFGAMNLFARALGGIAAIAAISAGDCAGACDCSASPFARRGWPWSCFSQMRWLPLAIGSMMLTGLFVKMSNGANYAVVPYMNKRALGAVAGIVGAGGNLGAVLAGFLFKTPGLTYPEALEILGFIVAACSMLTFAVHFPEDGGIVEARPAAQPWPRLESILR